MDSRHKLSHREEEFLEYRDALTSELAAVKFHLRIWKQVLPSATDYPAEVSEARVFFLFTIRAHLYTALMQLSKIVDKREKALSIWNFLNLAKRSQGIFSDKRFLRRVVAKYGYGEQVEGLIKSHLLVTSRTVEVDRDKLDSLKEAIEDLEAWRDKQSGHVDIESMLGDASIAEQYRILVEKSEEILRTLVDILNRYSMAYDATEQSIDIPFESSLSWVLDSVRSRLNL